MFDQNKKIMVGSIDCTDQRPKFNVRSITRYRHLYQTAIKANYEFEDFQEMDNFFIEDIRMKREVLKYLFYIENKLGAEIVNFLLLEKEFIETIFIDGEFIQINKIKPSSKIEKMNKIIMEKKISKASLLPDNCAFGEKLILQKVLTHYSKLLGHSEVTITCTMKELKHFKNLRNKIVHHGFILLDGESLLKILRILRKYITIEYIDKYNIFLELIQEKMIKFI